MKLFYLISLISIGLLFASCTKKTVAEVEKEYFTTFLEQHSFPKQTEWVIILPGLGCHGCIQEGEAFMKDHANDKNTSFVLTRIESLKILSQKTGVKIADHPNILVDTAGMVKIPTENIVYPCIIHLKNGRYQEHAFQSPQNSNAFNQLRMLAEKS